MGWAKCCSGCPRLGKRIPHKFMGGSIGVRGVCHDPNRAAFGARCDQDNSRQCDETLVINPFGCGCLVLLELCHAPNLTEVGAPCAQDDSGLLCAGANLKPAGCGRFTNTYRMVFRCPPLICAPALVVPGGCALGHRPNPPWVVPSVLIATPTWGNQYRPTSA